MGALYVARSPSLAAWASDVGLSKHVFKLGYTDEPPKPLAAAGWCGWTDWTLVKALPADGIDEAAMLAKVGAGKVRMIEPELYPRLKGTLGIFKVTPQQVENHRLIERALAGAPDEGEIKLKPADFANYLLTLAKR